MPAEALQPIAVHQGLSPGHGFFARDPADFHPENDVVQNSPPRQQHILLQHVADMPGFSDNILPIRQHPAG
ncbi:hypothetical protein D3C73_1427760 [compost metagenome]